MGEGVERRGGGVVEGDRCLHSVGSKLVFTYILLYLYNNNLSCIIYRARTITKTSNV